MNWNERYRVNSLDEIKGHNHEVEKLKAVVDDIHNNVNDGDCPHIYLTGPAGTGKTAAVEAFLKTAFDKDWRINYQEFNASETRIEDIRRVVIDLAGKDPLGDYVSPDGKHCTIPFNTIFFDEIDYLPPKSQAVLRRVMEKYAVNTRFVLSCNYDHKVIDALKSRCMCLHFGKVAPEDIIEIIKPIVKKEKVIIDDDALILLSKSCNGDVRKAQNILYKAQLTGKVDIEEIERCSNIIMDTFHTEVLRIAITAKGKNDKDYTKDFKMLDSQIDKLYFSKGYSGTQILMNIFDSVVEDDGMPIGLKRKLFASIGECMRDCSLVDDDIYALKMWLRSIQ